MFHSQSGALVQQGERTCVGWSLQQVRELKKIREEVQNRCATHSVVPIVAQYCIKMHLT